MMGRVQSVLKSRCTRSKQGRTLKRHLRQEQLDQMLMRSQSTRAKRDIFKRQHLIERSYAQGARYGFNKARWRRLWRVQIQEYLVAAVQNIKMLVGRFKEQRKIGAMSAAKPVAKRFIKCVFQLPVLSIGFGRHTCVFRHPSSTTI